MDVAGGLSLVQTILQLLDSAVWKEAHSVLGVKSQLLKLKKTMSTVDAILRDAEEQERLHHGCSSYSERDKLERLKEALYQADDLFDEITTLAHRKKLMPGNKLSKEVSLFFSRFNQLHSAFIWSREIKSIREELDDVVNDHQLVGGFRHSVVLEDSRVRNNPRETHSYVNLENDVIIGRDDDKRVLIDTLLDTTVEENVSVVSIVGIGGLGKTTLAQLVYNDDKIQKEFPLKMWVCVSDDFNVKALTSQILAAANPEVKQDGESMEELQTKLRQELDGKKYLLILDDVWNEDPCKWLELRKLLVGCKRGSKILVTTRSNKVAYAMRSSWTKELKGLSDDESLDLFKKMALKPEEYPMKPQLVNIGKEIVQKCANVPLAIKVVGSLLRGQGESKWQNFRNNDLANIIQDESNGIVPVLKISYNYLPFYLKSCFSYCAVFPKDYKIVKVDLICLWMAQGFIMPSNGESFEDAGEDYFKQLLQRCFFQDVELAEGTADEIISFKMHDLIHDLATEVAGTEILSSNCKPSCLNDKTRRHISIDESSERSINENSERYTSDDLVRMKRLRTFLHTGSPYFWLKLSKMKYLRVLCLNYGYNCPRKLSGTVGNLLHLRYLDLSHNKHLCVLPSSITKIYNLQTLKLYECERLESLPGDLRKLVNLRQLDIYGCSRLTCMPPGMNSMASLQTLTRFVVGGTSNAWYRGSAGVFKLEYLKNLTRHSEILEVVVKKGVRYNGVEARKGGFLSESKKLRNIRYYWIGWWDSNESDNAEALLQSLQPNSYLRRLELCRYYPGVRLSSWMMNLNTCLPNLVEIVIRGCRRLEHLPMMSQLRHLKVLVIFGLIEVEYMESSSNIVSEAEDDELVFFPSLVKLALTNMPKLKGWWKSESGKGETPQAPMLSHLDIQGCPNLTTFPLCPGLQELDLKIFNEALGPIMGDATYALSSPSISNNRKQQEEEGQHGRLRDVTRIDNVGYLNSLPIHSFHHLSNLSIVWDQKMERLNIGEVGEVFRSGRLSSLRSLVIQYCHNLKSISGRGVWDHFTALESLSLGFLDELELEDEDDVINNKSTEEGCINIEESDAEMPWRYLAPTLRSLKLSHLPKMVKLPKGIGCLSSLQSLNIEWCDNLESLTPSMGGLSSLQVLEIYECPNLESLTPSIGGLSSLQSLQIRYCLKLKTMAEEMRHLTSLTQLDIWGCSPELMNECKNKIGTNWSNIQHIPNIQLDY